MSISARCDRFGCIFILACLVTSSPPSSATFESMIKAVVFPLSEVDPLRRTLKVVPQLSGVGIFELVVC